jgi:hypothetical protein
MHMLCTPERYACGPCDEPLRMLLAVLILITELGWVRYGREYDVVRWCALPSTHMLMLMLMSHLITHLAIK